MNKLRELTPEGVKVCYRFFRAWLLSQDLRARGPFSLASEENRATAAISVIITVHDAPQVTARCLSSLEKFGGDAEVVIVDDGSKLEAVRNMLDEACSRNGWKLIRHNKAIGHSRASEAGVSASTRPYVCLLNSDTVITPRSWSGVVRAFESSPQIAVAGPSTSHTFGPQLVPRACHCRHYWSDEQIWCFAEKYVARHRHKPIVDVPFVSGFAFFIRRRVWKDLDGFDKNLPDYGNENEFCRRVLHRSMRIVWSKASYIHHFGAESYGRTLGPAAIRERSLQADLHIQGKHGQ
jgi:GT2 family glycosyltransferase